MLLGVPCVAVITGLMEDHVNEKLAEKNINLPVIKNEKVRKGKDKDKNKNNNKEETKSED